MGQVGGKREGAGRKPGSVSAATIAIRRLAAEHSEEALAALAEIVSNPDIQPNARVSAARELLDRGHGKSSNAIVVNFDPPLSQCQPSDALAAISDKATAGEISLDDAVKLSSLVEVRIRAVEQAEIERRLQALEEAEKRA